MTSLCVATEMRQLFARDRLLRLYSHPLPAHSHFVKQKRWRRAQPFSRRPKPQKIVYNPIHATSPQSGQWMRSYE